MTDRFLLVSEQAIFIDAGHHHFFLNITRKLLIAQDGSVRSRKIIIYHLRKLLTLLIQQGKDYVSLGAIVLGTL